MPEVVLKELAQEEEDMSELQRVLEEAPDYCLRTSGLPVSPNSAKDLVSALPPDSSYDEKHVYGIYRNGEMVGCIDLICGYPKPDTAMLGLFLLSESCQRKGLGKQAYTFLERKIQAFGDIKRIRIGVVRTNDIVLPFWKKLGFIETGELKPYQHEHVSSETIVLEKEI